MEQVLAGWLTKSPPDRKTLILFRAQWRRRYFVLYATPSSTALTGSNIAAFDYYDNDRLTRRKGTIDLTNCDAVVVQHDSPYYQHVFSMRTRHHGRERIYYLAADCETDMKKWIETLCQVLHLDNGAATSASIPPSVPVVSIDDSEERYTAEPTRLSRFSHQQPPQQQQLILAADSVDSSVVDQDPYILLDECFSGPVPSQQVVIQPTPVEYLNVSSTVDRQSAMLDNSRGSSVAVTNSDAAMTSRPWSQTSDSASLQSRNSDAVEYDFPPPVRKLPAATVVRQESEVDGAIWDCHSATVGSYSSEQSVSPPVVCLMEAAPLHATEGTGQIVRPPHLDRCSVQSSRPDSGGCNDGVEYDVPQMIYNPTDPSRSSVHPGSSVTSLLPSQNHISTVVQAPSSVHSPAHYHQSRTAGSSTQLTPPPQPRSPMPPHQPLRVPPPTPPQTHHSPLPPPHQPSRGDQWTPPLAHSPPHIYMAAPLPPGSSQPGHSPRIPPMHQSHVPSTPPHMHCGSAAALTPPPQPHVVPAGGVGGKFHRYINTPPMPLQSTSGGGSCGVKTSVIDSSRSNSMPTKYSEKVVPSTTMYSHQISEPDHTRSCKKTASPRPDAVVSLPTKRGVILSRSSEDSEDSDSSMSRNFNKMSVSNKYLFKGVSAVQYIDLELEDNSTSSPPGSAGTSMHQSDKTSSPPPVDATEYKEIDWLKTNALISTKKELETKRKSEKSLVDC